MPAFDLSPTGSWDQFPDETQELAQSPLVHLSPHFPQLGFAALDSLGTGEPSSTMARFAPAWSELLVRAVEEPGLICDAYTRFHGYSLGNRFGALIQCQLRGLEPGPLNSFNGWRKLGYAIKEGEKALTLCMPLKGTLHREKAEAKAQGTATSQPEGPGHRSNWEGPDIEEVQYIRAFVWKPSWFVLSQTVPLSDNTELVPVVAPLTWDRDQALSALDIAPVPFDLMDGNALGFARKRTVAVSPLAPYPFKTLFHEMAHVLLGHTTDNFRGDGNTGLDLSDGPELSPALIEVEAECVALLCLATLDLPGQEYCRGYIQHWLQDAHTEGGGIPEKSAQRIFGAADRILAAGAGEKRPRAPTAEEVGLSPGAALLSPTPPASDSPSREGEPTPQSAPSPKPLPLAEEGLPPPLSGAVPELQQTPLAARAAPIAALPLTQSLALDDGPARGAQGVSRDGELTTVTPGNERDAWQLHAHLQGLYNALHPVSPEDLAQVDRALRHLYSRDPETTREVRDLVKGVSRGIKSALGRIETLLDGAPVPESPATEVQTPSPSPTPPQGESTALAQGNSSKDEAHPSQSTQEAPVLVLETQAPPSQGLPPARQAAARRGVGRDLKSELEFERARFERAAKEHELPLGRAHDKEMLAAMSALLEVPLASRRDVSSHQWARCASAIATEDLVWGKSHRA